MSNEANDINALRALLFQTIRDVRAGTLATDQARTVNDLARTLVDTAKVEVQFLDVTGRDKSAFLEAPKPALPPGVTQHRLNG